jgi:membrane protein
MNTSFLKSFSWKEFVEREKKVLSQISQFLRILQVKVLQDDVIFLASGLAFNILLCFLPLLLLFIYLVGLLFQYSDAGRLIDNILMTVFPNQPHALAIRQLISTMLSEILTHRKSFGILSIFVLIIVSASLFSAMRSVLHRVFEIKERRHPILTYLMDLGLVLGSTFLIISTIFLRSFFHMLKHAVQNVPGFGFLDFYFFIELIASCASIPMILVLCYLLYRFVPVKLTSKRMAFISALTTTILWEVAGRLFSWYLSTFKSLTKTYGAYAFLIVLLIWIFYSCLVFVFGAEIGKLWCEKPQRDG